ncbi:hypothetical protein ACA910_006910 [Epithemia clementina (nom. ined.)]
MGVWVVEESIIAVCLAIGVILPRPDPEDRSWLGGDFSHPFRKGVLALTMALVIRATILPQLASSCQNSDHDHGRPTTNDTTEHCKENLFDILRAYFIWACLENVVRNFLRMLVPYLLQRQLASVINVIPGANLSTCLYFIVAMNLLAYVLFTKHTEDHHFFWGILIFQDATVGIILIRTFRHYNRLMGQVQEYAPSMLLRTIVTLEWMQLFLSFAAEWFGFLTEMSRFTSTTVTATAPTTTDKDSSSSWSVFIVPRTVVQHALVLMHAAVMNSIDEAEHRARTQSMRGGGFGSGSGGGGGCNEEEEQEGGPERQTRRHYSGLHSVLPLSVGSHVGTLTSRRSSGGGEDDGDFEISSCAASEPAIGQLVLVQRNRAG